MSEQPEREHGTDDTGLVSHVVETPEEFVLRVANQCEGPAFDLLVTAAPEGLKSLERDGVELAAELAKRDVILCLAVLEEAARARRSESQPPAGDQRTEDAAPKWSTDDELRFYSTLQGDEGVFARELLEVRDFAKRLAACLSALQWAGAVYDEDACPSCGMIPNHEDFEAGTGHKENCKLAGLLAEATARGGL